MTKSNESKPSDVFEDKKKKANQLVKEGNFTEAIPEYQSLIEMNPEYAAGYSNLGLIYLQQGNHELAKQYLFQSIQKKPELLEGYFNLGVLYQDENAFEKALTFYKEVVTRDKQDGVTFLRMGYCALGMDNKEDARAFFEESFRLQPNSLEAGAALASIYINLNRLEDAEEVLRVNLISYPEELSLHYSLGLVLRQQNKIEKALAHFKRVVNLDENYAQGFFYLGDCCLKLDFWDQAEAFLSKAFKLDQSSHDAVYLLGTLYENRKQTDKMILAYQQWVEMLIQQSIHTDPEYYDTFQSVCGKLIDHFSQLGEMEKSDYYRKFTSNYNSSSHETEDHPDDFNISLTIDD